MTLVFDIPKLQQWIKEIERQEPGDTAAARRECQKRLTEAWKKPYLQSSLAVLIQSDVPIKDVAETLRRQCEPQQRGKPGGQIQRWRRPHYLVAYLRSEQCAERSRDKSITHWLNRANGWALMRGKPPLDPSVG